MTDLLAKIPSKHMPDNDTPILFKIKDSGEIIAGVTRKDTDRPDLADEYQWWADECWFETSRIEWWIYLSDVTKIIRVEV